MYVVMNHQEMYQKITTPSCQIRTGLQESCFEIEWWSEKLVGRAIGYIWSGKNYN